MVLVNTGICWREPSVCVGEVFFSLKRETDYTIRPHTSTDCLEYALHPRNRRYNDCQLLLTTTWLTLFEHQPFNGSNYSLKKKEPHLCLSHMVPKAKIHRPDPTPKKKVPPAHGPLHQTRCITSGRAALSLREKSGLEILIQSRETLRFPIPKHQTKYNAGRDTHGVAVRFWWTLGSLRHFRLSNPDSRASSTGRG